MLRYRYEQAKQYGYLFPVKEAAFYERKTYRNALEEDGVYRGKNREFPSVCRPKVGSHDSGPYTGFFSGGFGTASFSRNALGYFDRWQLQQGLLTDCVLENAYFEVRWKVNGKIFHRKLRVGEDGFQFNEIECCGLFPVFYERYRAEDMPFEIIMERYSPVIPHQLEDSSLPVTIFDLYFLPRKESGCEENPGKDSGYEERMGTEENPEVSVCLCWPNVLGWKMPYRTSEIEKGQLWPSQQNAGNYAVLESVEEEKQRIHIRQSREQIGPADDLCGNVMLSMEHHGWTPSYDVMFKETLATTGYAPEEQLHTIGKMRHDFVTEGRLSDYKESWQTHWHEAMASALAAGTRLGTEAKTLTFVITMDLPVTQFGMGRQWYKYYTEHPAVSEINYAEVSGRAGSAKRIADYALERRTEWLEAIGKFHEKEQKAVPGPLAGCRINELYYTVSGGSVCISKPVAGWNTENAVLGEHPHFGLLEGFDTGYYYYNTLDLWVYGFAALSRHWPELAEWGFKDYLASALLTETRGNMIYRDKKMRENLIYGKLPHDLGGCAEDLFVRLNGYNFRDTPNMWKDHNPSFVLAFYLHRTLTGTRITKEEYEQLKVIMDFTYRQDVLKQGIPSHDEFGDSTWDNLHMRGLSSYCGSLCVGAWAVMELLAKEQCGCTKAESEAESKAESGAKIEAEADAAFYGGLKRKAQETMQKLWNGSYFTTDEYGKYKNATMSDAMFGLLLAKKAGLADLIPREQAASHLRHAYQNNYVSFADGKYGALLVAEPSIQRYEKDGGDEMQVNEVLVGSSWVLAACLAEYGLKEEAEQLTEAMQNTLKEYCLYYRTPAAWTGDSQFRAPMNMRPLAVWLI